MTIPAENKQDSDATPEALAADAVETDRNKNEEESSSSSSLDRYVVSNSVNVDEGEKEELDDDEDLSQLDPASLHPRQRMILHWKQNPFAVGCVNVKWVHDRTLFRPKESQPLETNPRVCCSAYVCGFLGAGRVGNLAVLAQTTEEYDHVETLESGERRTSRRKRPKLLWVVGPFWPITIFVTYPLILGASFWTGWRNLPGAPMPVVVSWSLFTFLLIYSLAMVACRNPGVLYRHREPPPDHDGDGWRWNDQAKTYRPLESRFDPECQAVIEEFDHTCPWTGTAIGSNNMIWFRVFVTMVPICIVYAVVLNIF